MYKIDDKQVTISFKKALKATISKLQKERYSIINEDDFKCYLFASLSSDKVLGKEFVSNSGEKLKIIHSEYYHPNSNGSGAGSFDIAVLDPNRLHEDINIGNRSIHNRKPVLIGCEIKWRRNSYREYIEYWIEKDSAKFIPNKNFTNFASKLGYVIYVHFADNKLYQHNKREIDNLKLFMRNMQMRLVKYGQKIKIIYIQVNKSDTKFEYKIVEV
ncbi:MAG: hypothetical protein WC705_00020 [Candidatus Paceibacterota bacterium]|jgi:hypothetical protein